MYYWITPGPIVGKIWKHWKHFSNPLLANHLLRDSNGNILETSGNQTETPYLPSAIYATNDSYATIDLIFPRNENSSTSGHLQPNYRS